MRIAGLILTAFCFLLVSTPAHARLSGPPPHANIYEGLLAPGTTVQDTSEPLDVASLRGKKAIQIPSANFNQFAEDYAYYYEEGGFERNWATRLNGMTRDTNLNQELAVDPRGIADRLIDAVRPYFAEVSIADDFQQARDQGADYYIVLDFWMGSRGGGAIYRSVGGVHLLDGQLRRVFSAEGQGEVRRDEWSFNVDRDAGYRRQSGDAALAQMIGAMTQRLGPPQPQ